MNTEIPQRRWFVSARSWFDRVNGNSYHTLRIWDSKYDESTIVPIQYGQNYLPDAGRAIGEELTWRNATLDIAYVARKKDLHNGGKRGV